MAYVNYRNVLDKNFYRWNTADQKYQFVNVVNGLVGFTSGSEAVNISTKMQSLVDQTPENWESISDEEWTSLSEAAFMQIDFDFQDDTWNDSASFYYNVLTRSTYKWSRAHQKFQCAGIRTDDKTIVWSMSGEAAVRKIDILETVAQHNVLEWIPSSHAQFVASLVPAVQRISAEIA